MIIKKDNCDSVMENEQSYQKGKDMNDDIEEDDDDDFGFDPERYVPFDEKVGFADLIKRCTKDGLTQIVK